MQTLVLIRAFHEAEPWEQPPAASSGSCEILPERYSDIFGGLTNSLRDLACLEVKANKLKERLGHFQMLTYVQR